MKDYVYLTLSEKNEKPVEPKTTKVFSANSQVTSRAHNKFKFPPCVLCKVSHTLWTCAVFKEKNATQRAKYVAEQKLCFDYLNGNHGSRQDSRAKKSARSQNAIAHIISRSMEPKNNFLGRKIQMC